MSNMNYFNNFTSDFTPTSKANMESGHGKFNFLFTNSMNNKGKKLKYSLL